MHKYIKSLEPLLSSKHLFSATINVTVDSATNLTKNIQEFMAKVDLELHLVSFKVDATANTLGLINALVVKQAQKTDLKVDKDIRTPRTPGEIRGQETDRSGIDDGTETREEQDAAEEVLSLSAFKTIMERSEGLRTILEEMTEKIKEALKNIALLQKVDHGDTAGAGAYVETRGPGPPTTKQTPGRQLGKTELSDGCKKRVHLTQDDVVLMENTVEIHWKALYYIFIVFQHAL